MQTQLLGLAPRGDSTTLRALKIFAFAGILCNLGATLAYVTWGRTMAWIKAIIQLSLNDPNPRRPHLLGYILWFAFMLEFIAYTTSLGGSIFLLCHIGIHVWSVEPALTAEIITPFLMCGSIGLVTLVAELILRVVHGSFLMKILHIPKD